MKKNEQALAAIKAGADRRPAPAPVPVKGKRAEMVFIGGQFPVQVRNALKMAEARSGRRLKPLLAEAFNYVCEKYGVTQPCSVEE